MRSVFKLYPWEWMVHEEFADAALERMGDEQGQTLWIEPIWKMLWSNKGILPVLWRLYPGPPEPAAGVLRGRGAHAEASSASRCSRARARTR